MITVLSTLYSILEDVFIPIAICVILPCLIVWLVQRARRHEIDKKTEIAIKAIENGAQMDPNLFAVPKKSAEKTRKGILYDTLKGGLVCTGLGIAFLVIAITKIAGKVAAVGDTFSMSLGLILIGIGAALIIAYFIGRKQFAAEIEAEEDKIVK